jgi:hypothetical protein
MMEPSSPGGGFYHAFEGVRPSENLTRPCADCGQPTPWQTDRRRGRATHPHCLGHAFDRATPELLASAIANIAAVLPVLSISQGEDQADTKKTTTDRRLGNAHAGCQICGAPYAGPWIAARTWRCAAHPPGPEHYRRFR